MRVISRQFSLIVLLMLALSGSGGATSRSRSHVCVVANLRSYEGQVEVRCSHVPTKSWRGIDLHAGDVLRVGRRGWISISLESTGARYLVLSRSSVRIDRNRISRLSGPMPQRIFDTPREQSSGTTGVVDTSGDTKSSADQ